MAEDLARGKKLLRWEHYEVLEALTVGDRVALQVRWTGIVDVAIGALQPGDSMICDSGIFLKFQEDKIIEQHNYDCFEDFLTPRNRASKKARPEGPRLSLTQVSLDQPAIERLSAADFPVRLSLTIS